MSKPVFKNFSLIDKIKNAITPNKKGCLLRLLTNRAIDVIVLDLPDDELSSCIVFTTEKVSLFKTKMLIGYSVNTLETSSITEITEAEVKKIIKEKKLSLRKLSKEMTVLSKYTKEQCANNDKIARKVENFSLRHGSVYEHDYVVRELRNKCY